ncbi:hypothetical protein ACFWB0_25610 [Rhodococcus sp. NPDC060086]|uniref:hypothetical protein n=1 Tax=unclassified Rhodococcus (in: high G+C Gram-positive bacteria) TaxID=192944 RepID=UPI00146F87A1|nr:hypothetical protein [Rhodococcus sp. BL-253-APC-6A1W]NMD97851.1 hypothetical protein [Rhodococcus sp. BL-253-APC-6A1W]
MLYADTERIHELANTLNPGENTRESGVCDKAISGVSGLISPSATSSVLAVLGGLADAALSACHDEFTTLSALTENTAESYRNTDDETAQQFSAVEVPE